MARRSRQGKAPPQHPLAEGEYHPAGKLARRVAVVTGAEGGAGRAVAILFAREGADLCLIVPPQTHAAGKGTQDEVSLSGGRSLLLSGDLLDRDFCRRVTSTTVETLGRLDILVNAPCLPSGLDTDSARRAGGEERLSRHLSQSLEMARAAVDYMEPGSAVINAGEFRDHPSGVQSVEEAVSRGALLAFTRSLASALGPSGVRVNCVDPGSGAPGVLPPCAPWPEDVAPTFVYLAANPDSRYVTGEIVTVRGREPDASGEQARSTPSL
jgi:NAD(P)-dependent dehydrogenase (short-subunit alcohol dehydrogenase family)